VPARLINIKYITTRAEKVASPVTALHTDVGMFHYYCPTIVGHCWPIRCHAVTKVDWLPVAQMQLKGVNIDVRGTGVHVVQVIQQRILFIIPPYGSMGDT